MVDQIAQNFVNVANGERVVPGAFDEMELAMREAARDILGEARRKRPILCAVPERDRDRNFLEGKSPRRCVNFRIRHHAAG